MKKNNILLTITTINGSKQYSITQIIKKFIIGFLISGILLVVGTFFLIKYLNNVIESKSLKLEKAHNEMEVVLKQKKLLTTKINRLESNISSLENSIKKKEEILTAVSDKLEDIEKIMQFSPEDTKDSDLESRVDFAKMKLEDKNFVLRNIPNGYPVIYKGVTSKFGWRIHPIRKTKDFHPGIDLRAKIGTPVYATADGIVEFARFHKTSGYGKLLIIDHNFGFKTIFAHLSKIIVKSGRFVKKGQLIAYTGNTGLSNGPHLHYEIRYLSMVLNPVYFMMWDIKHYNTIFKKIKKVKWNYLIKAIEWQQHLIKQK